MKNEEQKQQYETMLEQKVEGMANELQPLARLLIGLSETGYLETEALEKCKDYLQEAANDEESRLFDPLVQVLEQVIGNEQTEVLRYIIKHAAEYPYAQGYYRRPYRTTGAAAHLERIIQKTVTLLLMDREQFQLMDYLSNADYPQSRNYHVRGGIGDLIGYELDRGNQEVREALTQIIYGDNQTALLSHEMIKGIFLSHQEDMYQMIGELLKAARLQEGLRQSIVERMDEGTLAATLCILRLIIDEGYIRYSSVVRALGVWTGMNLEAANQRVAGQLIEQAYRALTEPEVRKQWQDSSNANEIFIALWATAVYEERDLYESIERLMKQGQRHQKIVAQYVLINSQNRELRMRLAREQLDVTDPELQYWVLTNYCYSYYTIWGRPGAAVDEPTIRFDRMEALEDKNARIQDFQKLLAMFDNMAKEYSSPSKALDFVHVQYTSDLPVQKMLYLTAYDMDTDFIEQLISRKDRLSPDQRGALLSHFMTDQANPVLRAFILESLTDKSMKNREHALEQLKGTVLADDELGQLEDLLKLKTGSLRQSTIGVLLKQPEEQVTTSLTRLLQAGNELQRLGGLEVLAEISKDDERSEQMDRLRSLTELIAEPTAKEQTMLDSLGQKSGASKTEGFGLFDPKVTESWLLEKKDVGTFTLQEDVFTLPFEKAKKFLQGLDELVHKHRDVEYVSEYYSGYKDTLLVGTNLRELKNDYNVSEEEEAVPYLERYPLHEEWRAYLEQNQLTAHELMQLYFFTVLRSFDHTLDHFYGAFSDEMDYAELRKNKLLEGPRKAYIEKVYPLQRMLEIQEVFKELTYSNQTYLLVRAFYLDSEKKETFELAVLAINKLIQDTEDWEGTNKKGLFEVVARPWLNMARLRFYDDQSFKEYYHTAFAFDQLVDHPHGSSSYQLDDRLRAFESGIIGEAELYKALLGSGDSRSYMWSLTSGQYGTLQERPKLLAIRNTAVDRIVSIELTRGDLPTEVTPFVTRLQRIEGMEYWVRLLAGLDRDAFVRGYIYGYNDNLTKKEAFSHLLKNCHPRAGEDAAMLGKLLKEQKGITEKRLLEAAMYAPQWIDIVAELLGWEGLRSAAWYFHAHINESFSAEKETVVAHYSPITPQDFNDGAFDIRWFQEAYQTLGEKRFKLLYECAKYISAGANHRRSQLFADATLGKLELEKMQSSVAEKRNKDHLLSYSLIPLSVEREQDLRERYDFIQQFLLQSKKFGAQRRASESVASLIALDNLARNAGYRDVTRLKWDMEARKVDEMRAYFEPNNLDEETTVQLVVDAEGQAEIYVSRKGKELKSVPAKHKKDEYILALKEMKSELTEQYRRARNELERSMTSGNSFTGKELAGLDGNPVIRPMLRSLVFKFGDHLGYYEGEIESLRDPSGKLVGLTDVDEVQIAHPVHFYKSGLWSTFQRDLFDRQLRQPFKQVFRELYVPNADELAHVTHSRRYAGYQVQPKKTVALLRGRQWTVSYEEGLQKVFYAENLIASLYAMADWFSPSDTEAPTLEVISFKDRTTYQSVGLDQVPPVLFSEVMRDVDLVVSVAHVGGVDPEASLTTIEMRHAIVQESLRLLKLKNVRLDGNYARVDGSLGEFAVHLGSGMVYKQATGALHIIPVHSQHRGRIFLPFLDEDPKTAEILSKIVMLAEDTKIKDPQILMQLQS
ncbi:hypothetical protein BRE01_52860 [Brevibacillus reuszeri]|uniref:DUF4132 domain-containing protein n=1 Tax=Brevibacillus reuszeri TaxID=54915 RepID=A0A0K9YKS1_9BACL|nr:DUF4132 domain-containing protein [Brevibacillus reuszeri]KNB69271.1 hypothetical protein ADS79_25520 [Brevibacillus reuszeri]MED1860217.1 DUF4132 domain-containing protein [Brevibacillus reuszeri]GED71584.1 hypothetical protein BRE01_52860 [Brevibacillus reuszeri]